MDESFPWHLLLSIFTGKYFLATCQFSITITTSSSLCLYYTSFWGDANPAGGPLGSRWVTLGLLWGHIEPTTRWDILNSSTLLNTNPSQTQREPHERSDLSIKITQIGGVGIRTTVQDQRKEKKRMHIPPMKAFHSCYPRITSRLFVHPFVFH